MGISPAQSFDSLSKIANHDNAEIEVQFTDALDPALDASIDNSAGAFLR